MVEEVIFEAKIVEAKKPVSPVAEPDTVEKVEEVISEAKTFETKKPASPVSEPDTVEKVEQVIPEVKTFEAKKPASPVSEPDTDEKVEEVISEAKTVVAKKPASPVSEPDTVEKVEEVISEAKTFEAKKPASPVSEPDTVEKVEEMIFEAKTFEAKKTASPVSEPDTVEKVEEVISETRTDKAKTPASPVSEPDTIEKVDGGKTIEAEKPASPVSEPDTVENVEEVISETRTVEAEQPASSVAEPGTVEKVEELISEGKTDEAEKPASPVSEPDTVEKVEEVISEAKTVVAKKPASPVSEPDTVEKEQEVISEDKTVEAEIPASPVSEPDTVEKVEEVISEAKTDEAEKPASPVSEPDTVEKVEEVISEAKTVVAKKPASPVTEPDTVEKVEEVISETRIVEAEKPASPVAEPDTVEKVEEVISETRTVEAEKPASSVAEPDTVQKVEELISEGKTDEAEKPASPVSEPDTVEKVEQVISEAKTYDAKKPASPVSEPDTVEKVEEVILEDKIVEDKKPASPVSEPDTVEKVEEVIPEAKTFEAKKPASPVSEPDTVEKVEEMIFETKTFEAKKTASPVSEPDTVEKVEEVISETRTDKAKTPASPVSEPDTVEKVEEVISEGKTVEAEKPASPVSEPDTVENVEEVISETRTVEAEKPASSVAEPYTVEKVEELISEGKTDEAEKPASPVSEPDTVEKVEEVISEAKTVVAKKPASPVTEPDTVEKVEEVISETRTVEAEKPASPVAEPDTVEKVEEVISETRTVEAEKPASSVAEPDTVEKVEELISEGKTDEAEKPASPVSEPDTVENVEEVISEAKTVVTKKPASPVTEPDTVEKVEEVISETRTVEAEKPASPVSEPDTVEKVEEVISEAKTVVAKKPTSPVTEPDTVEKVEEVISETRTVEAEKPASPVAEPDTVEKLEEMISEDKTVEAMKPTLPVAEPEKVEEEETEPVGKVEIVSETRTVEVEKPASPVSEPDTVGKVEEVISEAKTVEAKKPASPVSEPKKVEEDETEPLEKVEVISETKTADAEKSASPIAEPDTVEKMEEVISEAKIVGAEKPASPVAEPDVVEKVEEVITKAKTIEAKKPASPVAEPKKVEEDETEPVEKVEAISETKIVEAEKQESPVAGPDTVGKVEEVISEAKTVETKKPVSPVAELKKVEEDETEPVEKVEVISETKIVEAEKPASPVAEPDTIDKVKEVESEHVEKVEVISEAKTVEAKKPTSPVSEPDTVEKVEEVISEATTVEAKKPASPVTRPDTIEHVEEVDSELSKMVEEVVSEAKTVEAKKPALPVSEPDTIEKVKEVESELVKKVEVVVSEAKTAKAEKSASAVAEFHSVENQEEVDYELVEKVDITYVTKPKEKLTVEKPITADEAKTSEPEKPTLPVAEFESVDKIDLAVSETKFEKESSLEKFAEKSLISMVTESVSETDHSFTDANHDHVHTKIIENIDDSSSRLEKANNLEKNIENIAITTTNESEIAEQNIIHETESRIVEKSIVEMNESTSGMTGTHYSTAQTGMSTNEQNIERQELSVDESKPIDENTLKILRLTDSQFDETTFITETTTLRKILEATEKVKTSLELRLNSKQADISNVAQESEHAFSFDERRDSDAERLVRSELSAPSERSDILEDLRREESRLADTRKSSLSAVEGSNYDDDSPLLTDFTTSSITYVSERVDSSSLDLMAGDSFGDFLKVVPAVEKKTEAISPSSCISYATTISETIESFTHDADKLVYTGGSIQQDIPTEYERSVSLSDNAASDFSTESATKYNLPYDTESDSHDVAPGIPKPRDELQEIRVVKPSKLMSIDPRHESGSPQSDVTEYTESVSYVESIIDSTNYDCALKQREKLQHDQQQKQEEKKDVQEKLILEEGQTAKEEKGKLILKTHTAEKKETTQVKKKSKPKATITKISLQKQTPIEISKQSIKTVDIKSGSKSVEYTTSTSRTTTVSRTFTSTRTHGYMQSTLSRDQKVLKPLNLTESTHSSPVKSSHRSTTSTTVVQPSLEKRARSSRDTSGSRTDMAATKSLLKSEPISTSAVKKQDPKPGVQSTKATKVSVERTGRSSSSSITSSTSRVYRTRKTTIESIDKQEPIRKADKEQANLVTKTTVSASKSSKERTNKSLIPVKVSTAKGSPKKETPSRTSAGKSPVKKPTKTTIEVQPKETVIVKTSKAATIDIEQMASAAKIGFVKTAPRVTKTVHSSGDSKRDDTYRCKSAMHYSYKDAVTFDHAEIPSSLPSSPSRLNKSSSNSTNVLTSEVFTRTIDSSKSIEVIYRQPSTSNELIRKINEYRYNDIDLTTDSSLSDSIALPSSSSEHESDVLGKRKRSGSPASPKPYATTSSTSLSTMATSRKQATTAVASSTSQQNINEQRYRKSDIWMRTGPQPSEVIPVPLDSGDDEIYQALHTVDRRTVASLDGIVMESRISPILDFRASTPPRLKYKFDYDSSLFTDDKQEEETQASANFEGEEYLILVQSEASNLVDSILEQSVSIVNNSQMQPDVAIDTQAQSESEQYAIRSDILSSNEADLVVKSPTIESMSGKSFDDNISNPDCDSSDANQHQLVNMAGVLPPSSSGEATDGTTRPTGFAAKEPVGGDGVVIDDQERRASKIERRFERLSSEIEPEALLDKNREYDEAIAQIKDEVSMLQSEFSKMSWDESMSATTGDFGSSTPDNDLQETDTQPQTEISIPKPTPRSQSNLAAEADASAVTTSVTTTTTTTAATSSAAAVASSLTKSALASKPTEEASIVDTATDHDRPAGLSGDASELSSSQEPLPVPRPRTSISSRTDTQTRSSIIESFDHPEDSIEQYPEPLSQRQESVASEDFSGAAQKDSGEFETSEDELPETKFYIGERSSDIITRTSSEKRSDYAFDNIGYEYSQDSGADDEPQLDQFKAYREKVAQEDSFTLKQLQEVESGTDLDQEIKAEVIEVIEGIAEPKVFELDLEKSFDAPRQPVVHSPIKPQVAKLVASAKPFAVESTDTKNLPQPELTASSEIIKRTFDELTIEKTLEEVKESLDAVHEELIESVVDGKLIKQSPSEFEFKVLPSSKYSQDPIYETQQEEMVAPTTSATVVFAETVTTTTIVSEPIMLTETKAESFEQKTSDPESKEISFESARPDAPTPISSDSSFAKLDISPRMRKPPHHPKGTRWSATDIDSSGESHYQSFEQTTDSSRPQSSDVDNLIQQYASSEYETALDASIIPASTEFHSAASTLNSFNVSSHDSMKSFDSESSGNLASIESEATETLVPSTMDIDFDSSDAAALIHDDSEDDLREKLLLDDKDELSAVSVAIPVAMKRSQEMHFTADLKDEVMQDTQEVFQLQEDVERIAQEQSEKLSSSIGHALDLMESMKASSLEDVKTECIDDIKLGTSLEDGSILSISLSSASNLETIMENLPEKGAESLPTHMEIGLDAITPIVGTEMIGDITLTSTVVQEGDVNFLNTQATTETVVAEETSKKRGHKRTESTISGQLMSEIAAEARESLDSQEESVSLEASKQSSLERDDTREESSDSDYDRYESEYSRSFRAPLIQSQKKKKDKLNDGFEMEVDHDRRNSFSPSSSVIETIVEDVHAEIEQEDEVQQLMEFKEEKLREYKQTSATSIPDIQVTDDVQMDELEEEEAGASYSTKTMQRETSDPKIQYAKQEEFKISEEQYQEMIEQKYKSKMADITTKFDFEGEAGDDSAGSDSFEMLEQPDISDEFVIVEEVAREAHECDMEGKSVSIKQIKMEKKHDEDVEKILVKSAPAHTNAGSMYANMREDMMYTFEDSPPTGSDEVDPNGVTGDLLNNGFPLEESKRWVEMQLAETQNYRYPYDERLEDIKEEDTDFEVGSSRIGSIKDSFSSTPDYDMLAKRLASRGGEHDDISMSSLQEFENLEHVISLENRKMQQGSQDSLSNGSFTKRFLARGGHGDDISLSSLKEFEGLETACLEAHLIEIKAKEEAALLLSRSDESNKSDRSNGAKRSPPTNGTVVRATTSSTTVTTGPETVAKVEVKTVTTEMSKDSLSTTTTATTVTTISHESQIRHALEEEDTSHLLTVSSDSLDGTRLQRQTISRETLPSAHSSSDSLELNNKNNIDVMTSSIDSIEFSRAGAMTTRSSRSDSIEQMALQQPQRSDSTDSIEMHHAVMSRASETKRDSLDSLPYSIENKSASGSPTKPATGQRITTESVIIAGTSTVSYQQGGMTKDISVDSLTGQDAFLTSTESLETSSTATNATYQNETDSQMSSSVTSCGSITMVEGDIEGFGLQESVTFKSSSSSSSTIVMASSSSIQQQQQQQQTIRSSTSSTSAGTSTSVRREFPLSEIELLSRQMYPGDLAFDDAKESAKEKLQSKTTEKED
ncbi:microtubule-associated protein futsch-like isoform X2 [Armigeres subalbatus]|uniref:microtubule-associated protein futsch-like isoform X2 n=1 Tax=Armigeres subalbatus TaxID=124917 RepID=UPI002ED4BBBF